MLTSKTPCPHCGKATIGYLASHASWSGGPARCPECGGLSYLPTVSSGPSTYGSLIFFGWPLLALCLAIITGSLLWTAVIILVVYAALVFAHESVLQRTKLIPVSPAEVSASRRSAFMFAGVLLVIAAAALTIGVMRAD